MPYAIGAYLIWGVLPIYLGLLHRIPSSQIVMHRMVWSAVFMIVVIAITNGRRSFADLRKASSQAATMLLTTFLIGSNWYVYVYAVGHGHVLETSLGYFICPLLIVLLGRVVLKERWDRLQKISVALASCGVMVFFLRANAFPVYALYLAFTFGLYALIRKKLSIPPVIASCWEMLVMSVVAGLALLNASYQGEIMQPSDTERWLLLGSGVVTALPLWWFNEGAKRLPLKTVGILQYLAPCLQFLCAVLFFKESFGMTEAIGFGFIWLAIAVYILRLLGRVRS